MFIVLVPQNEDLGFRVIKYTIQSGRFRGEKRKRRLRRGVRTIGYVERGPFATYDEAWLWIFHHQSCSVHCALAQQGYKIEERVA